MTSSALPRRRALLVATLGLLAIVGLLAATSSRAAETIFWNNYSGDPDSIGFANIDGTGGGALNLGTEVLSGTEGMAYDTVTNRLFVANISIDKIVAINLDGSGASSFAAPGAPIEDPEGVVVDPLTRTIYWINTASEAIAWANLDGSSGGLVATGGAKVDAYRLSLDPVANRLYWYDETAGSPVSVSTAGGTVTPLNITGATPSTSASGIAVEPGLGKVFWANDGGERVSWASLAGTGGGDIIPSVGSYDGAYGIAVDAALGRLYWANYSTGETRSNALGFANIAGGGGPIAIATAPVDGPQDPIVLKSPAATGAPALSRTKGNRAALSCSAGSWGADAAGAFLYQAPRGFAYQWALNGKAIAGATATTLNAAKPGKYTCTVTATNQAGSAAQTSAVAKVEASKAKLKTKKKVTVKAGGTATFPIKITNQGDLKSKNAKLCVQLPKAAKGALKAPKCKSLGKLKSRGKKSSKLKIRVLPSASGVYSVSFKVKGTAGKAAKAKIIVK